ncbi:hypothetical protein K490DRAFT_56504 [Saccharata proteae CBS 121410]|uniref:Uncharacterized protein n=1 Tax=Saccharata proteae CBS 121410 TaxID=1314787 RepID=A0A9P4HWA0_9PEZI|nr:hypothetical protein K490DRAFT_56504 [Saccharata proteae CBS 121410]
MAAGLGQLASLASGANERVQRSVQRELVQLAWATWDEKADGGPIAGRSRVQRQKICDGRGADVVFLRFSALRLHRGHDDQWRRRQRAKERCRLPSRRRRVVVIVVVVVKVEGASMGSITSHERGRRRRLGRERFVPPQPPPRPPRPPPGPPPPTMMLDRKRPRSTPPADQKPPSGRAWGLMSSLGGFFGFHGRKAIEMLMLTSRLGSSGRQKKDIVFTRRPGSLIGSCRPYVARMSPVPSPPTSCHQHGHVEGRDPASSNGSSRRRGRFAAWESPGWSCSRFVGQPGYVICTARIRVSMCNLAAPKAVQSQTQWRRGIYGMSAAAAACHDKRR